MQCAILAGGYGTRMRPYTVRMPKNCIPVRGEPFVHYQLSWLKTHGIDDVVLLIGYLGEQIREAVGDGSRWGLHVSYVDEGEDLKGTAGALANAAGLGALDERFVVLYGDSFLPVDFRPFIAAFESCDRPAMMSVYRNEHKFDAGNVRYKDGVVQLYQKNAPDDERKTMQFIDYGATIFSRDSIETRVDTSRPVDLAEVCHQLSLDGLLAGYEVKTRFYEIGSPQGLADFEAWLSEHGEIR